MLAVSTVVEVLNEVGDFFALFTGVLLVELRVLLLHWVADDALELRCHPGCLVEV